MGKCSWGEGHGLLGPLSPLPTLTSQSQLLPDVTVHLDRVRLKTQGWGDTGIGELRGGERRVKGSEQGKPGEGQRGLCHYGGDVEGPQGKALLASLISPLINKGPQPS